MDGHDGEGNSRVVGEKCDSSGAGGKFGKEGGRGCQEVGTEFRLIEEGMCGTAVGKTFCSASHWDNEWWALCSFVSCQEDEW